MVFCVHQCDDDDDDDHFSASFVSVCSELIQVRIRYEKKNTPAEYFITFIHPSQADKSISKIRLWSYNFDLVFKYIQDNRNHEGIQFYSTRNESPIFFGIKAERIPTQ